MTLNNGLDRLGEHMSVKKYLYREEEEVFNKIEQVKKFHASEKFTTKDAITYLINKGYEAEMLPIPLSEPLPALNNEEVK